MQFGLEHQPIMVEEVLKGLNLQKQGIYVDATFGRGGHSQAILAQLGKEAVLLGLDRDPAAQPAALDMASRDPRFTFENSSFSQLKEICQRLGILGKVAGILLDLGVSSPQLDTAERGFSFRLDGPLDMRMDPRTGVSAAEWLNSAEEAQIAFVLKTYGEERFHQRIARAIITARSQQVIARTGQLAEIVAKANPAWEKHKHPATRSFQAIRIFVNHELEEITNVLEQALSVLTQHGRLVVISFHSLEDRLVKQFIQTQAQPSQGPRRLPLLASTTVPKLRRVGQKLRPSALEVERNPRARSAILRIAEKVSN